MLNAFRAGLIIGAMFIALPGTARAQITITNPSACDFDGDGISDEWTTQGQRGFASLSKTNKTKQIRMSRAYSHFTCSDRNNDGKVDLLARMGPSGRAKTIFVFSGGSAGLLKVCKSVRELQKCEIWKSQQSSHISKGDPRHRSTGFIATRGCPGGFPNSIIAYDSKGQKIHQLGEYFPTGSLYDSRHYGCFASGDCKGPVAIAIEARRETGEEEIYLKDLSGSCVRVPDPGQCYNSSGC